MELAIINGTYRDPSAKLPGGKGSDLLSICESSFLSIFLSFFLSFFPFLTWRCLSSPSSPSLFLIFLFCLLLLILLLCFLLDYSCLPSTNEDRNQNPKERERKKKSNLSKRTKKIIQTPQSLKNIKNKKTIQSINEIQKNLLKNKKKNMSYNCVTCRIDLIRLNRIDRRHRFSGHFIHCERS